MFGIPLNAYFRLLNIVLKNKKLKKEKWQSGQNLDLNPTYESVQHFKIRSKKRAATLSAIIRVISGN